HLEKLFRDSDNPLARVHALYTLEGMGELHPDYVGIALHDKHPGVRKHALRLMEPHLEKWEHPGVAFRILKADPDPQVRQQLALTLGEWKNATEAGDILGALAAQHGDDLYMVASIFSSVNKLNFTATLRAVLGNERPATPLVMDRLVKLASSYGENQGIAGLLEAIATPHLGSYTGAQMTAMAGFLDALHERNET